MEKQKIEITIICLLGLMVIVLSILSISLISNDLKEANTFIQCCNGSQCTDTYYTEEDNLCHLVLCENSIFTDKQNCVYPGKGIPLNAS